MVADIRHSLKLLSRYPLLTLENSSHSCMAIPMSRSSSLVIPATGTRDYPRIPTQPALQGHSAWCSWRCKVCFEDLT
jgi:hypothetical protein